MGLINAFVFDDLRNDCCAQIVNVIGVYFVSVGAAADVAVL